jgi:hypothetical protein
MSSTDLAHALTQTLLNSGTAVVDNACSPQAQTRNSAHDSASVAQADLPPTPTDADGTINN